ncbi:auxin efflux carrier component 5 [Rhodamnia argentea]|uniref:Auxin efflux carrier component n=1 Tax=Rhodamnia argentea TaxID=178133 RepID=A0A8B8P3B1_9MYRT|nr:auxin efflux carrier component 5 [Rhodamnia argentea]
MIELEDIYKVFAAMVPLYFALMLGYGSVRWWRMFTAEQCDGINRMVCYFIIPLFGFEFTAAHANLFKMNYSILAADAISKFLAVLMLVLCAKCSSRVDHSWCITTFSLLTLTNLLVVGIPILRSMYGQVGVDLVVQLSVVQAILWFPLLLCFLECRKMGMDISPRRATTDDPAPTDKDIEGTTEALETNNTRPRLCTTMKIVGLKLALNPNIYACVVGVAWAVIAHRFKVKLPGIVKESIEILSRAGLGTAMFNIGIFIAMQRKVIACGMKMTILGMVLRFVAGPALMTVSSLVMGLRGDVLRIAIIQAALPQAITTFIFAKEYGLHASVLSTAVVFGTLASLPLLIAYYAALEVI